MNPILEAKAVGKQFGGLRAVDNVSMCVNPGEIFGIIGPNGAGKTTFFNLCSGTFPLSAGDILLGGEVITGKAPEEIARKGLARTFQNIKLFNYMSVLNNVKVGCHINTKTNVWNAMTYDHTFRRDEEYAAQHSLEVLRSVGLAEFADQKAGNLPYGMQRKVEIARALATNPTVMLLDEPAAGMNPNETWSLLEFIQEIRATGHTVVVIEHDMKFVMNLCDRIMVLNFGQKICEGTPDHVREDEQVQQAYFGKSGTLNDTDAHLKRTEASHA